MTSNNIAFALNIEYNTSIRIKGHVILFKINLTLMKIIGIRMRHAGIILEETIQFFRIWTSTIIWSQSQSYLISPNYSYEYGEVLEDLGIKNQGSDISIL